MNKRRPTAGDKVRILSVAPCHKRRGFDVGQVHTIDEYDGSSVPYRIGEAWFMGERVELVEDEPDQVALVLAKALSELIDQNSTEGKLLKLLIEVLK